MTWEQAKKHIDHQDMTPPGPRAAALLGKRRNSRMMALSDLPWEKGICAWCDGQMPDKGRKKYCTKSCAASAYYYGYPQAHANKMYRLIHIQNCMCLLCGQDFSDDLAEIVRKKLEYYLPNRELRDDDTVTYHAIGYNTGHIWHTDHIVAVHQGGEGVGTDNHQTICVPCHHRKTAEERRPKSAQVLLDKV
jgi:5-methylcytosine-specific restriction endonuclease McrA